MDTEFDSDVTLAFVVVRLVLIGAKAFVTPAPVMDSTDNDEMVAESATSAPDEEIDAAAVVPFAIVSPPLDNVNPVSVNVAALALVCTSNSNWVLSPGIKRDEILLLRLLEDNSIADVMVWS